MAKLFYQNPRLLFLAIAIIAAAGFSAFHSLPRMEDPVLTKRFALIRTVFPGADAERVERSLAAVNAMPATEGLHCCHNDLVAENIVDASGLHFLDWEYACDNDPRFDLAVVIAHHDLTESQQARLLAAYHGGDGSQYRQELEPFLAGYEALRWLWEVARAAD